MKKWGINETNLIELDWWDTILIKDITFVCTPSRHYSGRLVSWKTSKTLWSSWVVQSGEKSFYFSGDSGFDTHYKEIGNKQCQQL